MRNSRIDWHKYFSSVKSNLIEILNIARIADLKTLFVWQTHLIDLSKVELGFQISEQ